ncbi:MAG: hypothetical protein ACOC22_00575 [bacterium]
MSSENIDEFIKKNSEKLKISEEKLREDFEKAKQEIEKDFGNQPEDVKLEKAKMKLKIMYKNVATSNTESFVGVIVAVDAPRDQWEYIRNQQMNVYRKALEEAQKTGDETKVNMMFEKQVVGKDENGNIYPMWPKMKKDGTPSKMAGKPIPSPEESIIQSVYGIAVKENDSSPKGFVLELRNEACDKELPVGKVVTFRAFDRTKDESELFDLVSSKTDFLEKESEFFNEGLNKLGLAGMVERYFANYIVNWDTINAWVKKRLANPDENPIEEPNKLQVIPNSLCVYQNFAPNEKGNIKMNICSISDDISDDDTTALCIANENFSKYIDFGPESKIIVMGRLWIPVPKEDQNDVDPVVKMSGAIAYDNWKVPRNDTAKEVTEDDVVTTKTEEPQQTEETVVEEQPQQTEETGDSIW